MVRKLELNDDLPGTSVQARKQAHRTCPITALGSARRASPCLWLDLQPIVP